MSRGELIRGVLAAGLCLLPWLSSPARAEEGGRPGRPVDPAAGRPVDPATARPAEPPAARPTDPADARPALARIEEGEWLLYKGGLKLVTRREGEEPREISLTLEVAYLGLGPPAGEGGLQEVLVLRAGESPEDKDLAVNEAVTAVAGRDLALRPKLPAEDRARRISPLLFKHLPLGIFPPLSEASPRAWKGPARFHLLAPEAREVAASHQVASHQVEGSEGPAIRYTVICDPGLKASLVQEDVELPFEVESLRHLFTVAPAGGALLRYESLLEGKVLGGEGQSSRLRLEVDLRRSEALRLEGARRAQLLAEARAVQEIEKTLFEKLDPEGAQSRAQSFEKDHRGSRLSRFASGLALQADSVWPIVRERRLYGKQAPDFTLRDLLDKPVTLSRLLPGKVTLLSFWELG